MQDGVGVAGSVPDIAISESGEKYDRRFSFEDKNGNVVAKTIAEILAESSSGLQTKGKNGENIVEDKKEIKERKAVISFYERCFPFLKGKFSVEGEKVIFSGTRKIIFSLFPDTNYGEHPFYVQELGNRDYQGFSEIFELFEAERNNTGELVLTDRTKLYAFMKILGLKTGRIYFTNSEIQGTDNAWAVWVEKDKIRLKPVHKFFRLGAF